MINLETSRIQIQNILSKHNEVEVKIILSQIIDNSQMDNLELLTDIYKNTLNMPEFYLEKGEYAVLPEYSLRAFPIYVEEDGSVKPVGAYRPEGNSEGNIGMLTDEDKKYLDEYLAKCDKVWDITLIPTETTIIDVGEEHD